MGAVKNLMHSHDLHRTTDGMWMFQAQDGTWCQFVSDSHFMNTRDDPKQEYPIAFFQRVCYLPRG